MCIPNQKWDCNGVVNDASCVYCSSPWKIIEQHDWEKDMPQPRAQVGCQMPIPSHPYKSKGKNESRLDGGATETGSFCKGI